MIPLGREQHLGYKAFLLISFRHICPALGIFFIAVLLFVFHDLFTQTIVQLAALLDPNGALPLRDASAYASLSITVIIAIGAIAFIVGLIVGYLVYRFYTYTFDEFDLRLKRGVINREEVSIPYRQMQDINILRGLFYQILGVSKLLIDSAGHEETVEHNITDIVIEPVEREIALEIRSLLQHRIGVQVVENLS